MSAAHGIETVYPATVDAEVFRASRVPNYIAAAALTLGSEGKKPDNRADSDQEFGELVGKVLQSSYVLSAAQSLIARANDVLAEKELAAQNPTLTQPEVLAPEASPPQPPMLDTPSS
jgi:hypothetical protein